MLRRRPLLATLLLSVFASVASFDAMAAPTSKEKAEARTLVGEAKTAVRDKRWADASRALTRASELDPAPQTRLDLARALEPQGKLVAASKVLHELADSPPSGAGGQKIGDAAKKMLAEIEPKIPWLQVTVGATRGQKTKTTIDNTEIDASIEVPVDPGEHRIIAEADGCDPVEKTIRVAEGEHKSVKLTLASEGPTLVEQQQQQEASQGFSKAPAVIAFTLGAAGIGVGAAFGVMSSSQTADVKAQCNAKNVCPASVDDDLVTAKDNGNVSTIGFIVGGVGIATGVVLLIASTGSSKKKVETKDARHISPWIGPRAAGLTGRF